MSEYYQVLCASCGNWQEDESGEPEQFGFDQWRFHIEKCQHCGAKEGDCGLGSILIEKAETKNKCPKCGQKCDYIEERYSFGVYAGTFCDDCCKVYRDNCGLDQPQGSPNDLDEQYYED